MSNAFFTANAKMFNGAMSILDKDTILTEKVLKMENKNVGRNPMINFNISLKDQWLNE